MSVDCLAFSMKLSSAAPSRATNPEHEQTPTEMPVISSSLISIIAAQLLASAHGTPARQRNDTTGLGVDTAMTRVDTTPPARISFDLGLGLGIPVAARSFDFGISSGPGVTGKSQTSTTTQVRFVRAPDAMSAELARRVSSGEHISAVDVQLEGANGAPGVLLHLYDVQVLSSHLVANEDNVGLVQQRLGLLESIAQLSVDLQEAQRQLNVTESLDKRRLSSSLELAHARSSADVLARRLAVQHQRLALVERQLTLWTPIQEEVVLNAGRMDMETR